MKLVGPSCRSAPISGRRSSAALPNHGSCAGQVLECAGSPPSGAFMLGTESSRLHKFQPLPALFPPRPPVQTVSVLGFERKSARLSAPVIITKDFFIYFERFALGWGVVANVCVGVRFRRHVWLEQRYPVSGGSGSGSNWPPPRILTPRNLPACAGCPSANYSGNSAAAWVVRRKPG